MKNLRPILLAEDNPYDAELTLSVLNELKLGNPIIAVKDGLEVMEYLQYKGKFSDRKKGNPVVILMDIKMPRLDGIEVLQMIRKDPALRTLPVVMLTSSREDIDILKCYEQSVNAYVVKPVDNKEFCEAVRQLGIFWALINEVTPEKEN